MAWTQHSAFSPLLSLSAPRCERLPSFLRSSSSHFSLKIRAAGPDLLGDFGGRDPFPAEIETNFGEKISGYENTEHKILIPNTSALSLAEQDCVPASQVLSEEEAKKLLFKVVGWRIVDEGGVFKLQGLWKVRDARCGRELIERIKKAVDSTGHAPSLHFQEPNQVVAQMWTSSVGGLSINDFIVAAKIDQIKISDLQPRLRVWA